MKLSQYFDKSNLHHAYLIEGDREEAAAEVLKFLESSGIETLANPDFTHQTYDSFKMEDARNLKSITTEKGFTSGKKVFLISVNSFLLEAQNAMLKMFEEPVENTHFFVIIPDADTLLRTFKSRFYLISAKQELDSELNEAEKFIAMPATKRIDYIKELLAEVEEESVLIDSARPKAIKFLNAVENVLHKKLKNFSVLTLPGVPGGTYNVQNSSISYFHQIFKVREFLRMPGSSTKSLMESVALTIPVLQ